MTLLKDSHARLIDRNGLCFQYIATRYEFGVRKLCLRRSKACALQILPPHSLGKNIRSTERAPSKPNNGERSINLKQIHHDRRLENTSFFLQSRLISPILTRVRFHSMP